MVSDFSLVVFLPHLLIHGISLGTYEACMVIVATYYLYLSQNTSGKVSEDGTLSVTKS